MTRSDDPGSGEAKVAYTSAFIAKLELLWGEGFLSPGGPEEVALILEGLDLTGQRVLDIGCGIGGIDLLLVEAHGAASVLGIDVEMPVLERARARAKAAGLTERLDFRQVSPHQVAPGPLPLADDSFDLVFSKDAMVHIPDKAALYAEVLRVLRPGGVFAASDWMRGGEAPPSAEMRAWLRDISLDLDLVPQARAAAALEAAGFEDVRVTDRNAWYREEGQREVERLKGPLRTAVTGILGPATYETWVRGKEAAAALLQNGEFRPGHLRARKPA